MLGLVLALLLATTVQAQDTTPPTVLSDGYYSDAAATIPTTQATVSNLTFYYKVTFSENVKDDAQDKPSFGVRVYSDGSGEYTLRTDVSVVSTSSTLEARQCRPASTPPASVYICRYTFPQASTVLATFVVRTGTKDVAGNALASEYVATPFAGVSGPAWSLSKSSLTLTEGHTTDKSGSFTVTLTRQPEPPGGEDPDDVAVEVDVTSSDTGAVTVSPASITFGRNNYSTAQTVTVTAVDDADGTDETPTVSLSVDVSDTNDKLYKLMANAEVAVTVNDDDLDFTVSGSPLTVTEGSSTGDTFTVVLDSQPSGTVSVALTSDNSDLTLNPTSLSFSTTTWNSAKTVTVTAGHDNDGTDETVTVTISPSGGGYDDVEDKTVSVSVTDDDTPGLTLSGSTLTVTEGTSTSTFTVALATQPAGAVSVSVTDNSTEVSLSPATLNFSTSNWNTTQSVTVTSTSDDDGVDDTVTVTLNPASTDDTVYNALANSTLTLTVDDDDTPGLTLSGSTLTVTEGTSTSTFTVALATQPAGAVSVSVTDNSTEVSLSPATLNFSTSNWNTTQSVTVTSTSDDDGVDDTVTVTLNPASTDDTVYNALANSTLTLTVDDDDTPGLTLSGSTLTVTEGTSTSTFTVKLATQPAGAVSVSVTDNSTEVSLSPATLNFSTSNWNTTQSVTVTSTSDDDGVDDTVTVTLNPASTDDTVYNALANSTLTLTVDDDDTPGLTFVPTSLGVTEGATGTFTVALATQPTGNVSVSLSSNNSEVTVDTNSSQSGNQNSLSFTTSNWKTGQTVSVAAAEDNDASNDTVTLTLDPSGADYASLTSPTYTVTVTDNDGPGLTLNPATSLPMNEGATATFTVVLATQPSGTVTVTVGSDNTDVTVDTDPNTQGDQDSLSFTTSTWNTAQTVTVAAAEDNDASNDTATLTVDPSGADYASIDSPTLSVTVTDNDTPGLTVSKSALTVTEGATGTFTAVLDTKPTGTVTVAVTASSEVTLDKSSLSFTTTDWNSTQTVTVTGASDADKTDETATVTLSPSGADYGSVADATVTVTVQDDEATVPAKPETFTVTHGNGKVTLDAALSDTGGNGGAPILKWQYQYKTTGEYGDWTDITDSAADAITGKEVSSLTNGTAHTFQVRAVNRVGNGMVSDEEAATPQAPRTGGGSGGGSPRPPTPVRGMMENVTPRSPQSGIGLLSGWVCQAKRVEFVLNPGTDETQTLEAAYGTDRADTKATCGDRDNGFGLLFNWNLLGDGTHTVAVQADGKEFGRVRVTVTTLGEEFVEEAEGTCAVADFPGAGGTTRLVWQEAQQNFVIAAGSRPTGAAQAGTAGVGQLENPSVNSFQSGLGLVSGWVCEAEQVEVRLNGHTITAAYGTDRADTEAVCGDRDNGFGLLFNWNLLGDGEHEVEALADGAVFGRTRVRVTTLGGAEFVQGATGRCTAEEFPSPSESVTLEWQQNRQNFVITDVQ